MQWHKSRAKKAHSTDFLISFADWHFMIYSSKLRFHTFLCVSVAILFTRRSSHAARTHASRAPLAIRWHSYFRFRSSRIRIELKPQKRSDWVALPACHWPRVRSSRVSVANCLARWSPQPSGPFNARRWPKGLGCECSALGHRLGSFVGGNETERERECVEKHLAPIPGSCGECDSQTVSRKNSHRKLWVITRYVLSVCFFSNPKLFKHL